MKYTIEDLIKTFVEHSIKFEKSQKEQREKFPEAPIYDFNLGTALLVMCEEIQRLKK